MQTTRQIIWRILSIAFPMVGARLINMISVFIGMIMIARLGHAVLAASALISAAYYTVLVIFMFVLFSVGVVVGRHYGAQDYDAVGEVTQQGLWLAFCLALPMMLLFWYFDRILQHFGQNPQLLIYVTQFFHAAVWMVLPMLCATVLSQMMFAVTKVMNVMLAYLIGLGAFFVSAYAFIFGHWGCPFLGVAGFAYAIVIQEISMLLTLLATYAVQKHMHQYGVFRLRARYHWVNLNRLWQIGWPMSIQFGGELSGYFAITVLIGLMSVTDLAAWQVVQQIMMMFIVPVFSFAEASAIVVGHAVGAKEFKNINKINQLCTLFGMLCVVVGVVVFLFLPQPLARIYINHQHRIDLSHFMHTVTLLFSINAVVYFVDSYRNLMSGSLRGLYDTRFAMQVGIVVVWVCGVMGGYVLAFHTNLGVYGFSVAQAVAFFIGAVLMCWRWRWQMQRLHKTI